MCGRFAIYTPFRRLGQQLGLDFASPPRYNIAPARTWRILPEARHVAVDHPGRAACYKDILHNRNYSPYTARDFDISPYFHIIKPERPADFDYRALHWDEWAVHVRLIGIRFGQPLRYIATRIARSDSSRFA